jgi:hypothetical protein
VGRDIDNISKELVDPLASFRQDRSRFLLIGSSLNRLQFWDSFDELVKTLFQIWMRADVVFVLVLILFLREDHACFFRAIKTRRHRDSAAKQAAT